MKKLLKYLDNYLIRIFRKKPKAKVVKVPTKEEIEVKNTYYVDEHDVKAKPRKAK